MQVQRACITSVKLYSVCIPQYIALRQVLNKSYAAEISASLDTPRQTIEKALDRRLLEVATSRNIRGNDCSHICTTAEIYASSAMYQLTRRGL